MDSTAVAYARTHQSEFLSQLKTFLAIPSISTLTEHAANVRQAAGWLIADMQKIGLENTQIIETEGHPVVYADWLHAGEAATTILVYGHYDVQPPGDLNLWESPPFEPSIRNGRLYARGVSDNKAQHFTHLKAVESLLAVNGRLPINVKFCLDGEEEVGSPSLPKFVLEHQDTLACDFVLVSDGAMISTETPSIEYALRGVISAEIIIHGPERDLHSGSFGGSVHNPAHVIANIISALHDKNGQVQIPGFYDDVTTLSQSERELLKKVPYSLEQWHRETGAKMPWGEPDFSFYERMTARPTCEVNGLWSGFIGEGFRTIIPAKAGVKISMRLVEHQDAAKISAQFESYIHSLVPDTVTATIVHQAGANAAVTPYNSPFIQKAIAAYNKGWGARPILNRAGGSLPIIATFQEILKVPFVLMPFGLDDNRHAPNEHYLLSHFERGLKTSLYFFLSFA